MFIIQLSDTMASATPKNMSIYIPAVHSNISSERIISVFQDKYKWGMVDRVDMPKRADKRFKRAFVHFSEWNDNDTTKEVMDALMVDGASVKVPYEKIKNPQAGKDTHWWWKVMRCTAEKPDWKNSKHPGNKYPKRKFSMKSRVRSLAEENMRLKMKEELRRELIQELTQSGVIPVVTVPAKTDYDSDDDPFIDEVMGRAV